VPWSLLSRFVDSTLDVGRRPSAVASATHLSPRERESPRARRRLRRKSYGYHRAIQDVTVAVGLSLEFWFRFSFFVLFRWELGLGGLGKREAFSKGVAPVSWTP